MSSHKPNFMLAALPNISVQFKQMVKRTKYVNIHCNVIVASVSAEYQNQHKHSAIINNVYLDYVATSKQVHLSHCCHKQKNNIISHLLRACQLLFESSSSVTMAGSNQHILSFNKNSVYPQPNWSIQWITKYQHSFCLKIEVSPVEKSLCWP